VKISFLFLIVDNITQEAVWQPFLPRDNCEYSVYVHATQRHHVRSEFLAPHLIRESIPSAHGEIGMVLAELSLLRTALEDRQNQRFVFLSYNCVPIRRFYAMYETLSREPRSWMGPYSDYSNMADRYLAHADQTAIPRQHWRKNSSWVTLNRRHAEIVASDDLTAAFGKMFAPDEHYIFTRLAMAGALGPDEITGVNSTDVDWVRGTPYVYHSIAPDDIQRFRRSSALFARKFAADSDVGAVWDQIVG
jgi:hypothetical protein